MRLPLSPTLVVAWPGPAERLAAVAALVLLTSASACVDSGRADAGQTPGPSEVTPPALCEATPLAPYAGAATIPGTDGTSPGLYQWKNVAIKGGGFVTGIVMSPVLAGLAFARTDVGGAYRFEPVARRWLPVTDWVGHDNSNLMGIESIAVDPVDPNRVYLAAGTYLTAGNGSILSSTDMGQTWARNNIPAPMGGNVDGRSMGERLAIDPNLPSTLYFGSRTVGLWRSTDFAQTWSLLGNFPAMGVANGDAGPSAGFGLTFVVFDARSGIPGMPTPTIYVGVGVTSQPALYRSLDAGATWQAVPDQPSGMMPHHAVFDGCGNLYLTYNNGSGPSNVTVGEVWRHEIATGLSMKVTPPSGQGGFGGISADATHPGTLIVTTLDRWWPDGEIYRTTNGGSSWRALGAGAQRDEGGAVWLRNDTGALPTLGWMGDVEIDPFDPARALYITGQGIWSTYDLTAADIGAPTHWSFEDDGLEETVALDLVSPPAGAPLLTAVGDIAGFRHDDLDRSPVAGEFRNPVFGNTNSLDFAEGAPAIVARVGTNSAAGQSRGAYSTDGGATWIPFAAAFAASSSSGSIAVSADGQIFLWAPQGGTPSYSTDQGATWKKCCLGQSSAISPDGGVSECQGLSSGAKVAADRVNPAKLYASDRNGVYVSTDGGANFQRSGATASGRPRPVFGVEGDLWIATSAGLLHSRDSGATFARVQPVAGATAVGFGMPAPGRTYPAVYVAGSVANTWGVYRSDDVGETWQRVDDIGHQFGYINCLVGDPRRYGRVYLGTGGRGIVYGDPR